jgi:hypothetical protein
MTTLAVVDSLPLTQPLIHGFGVTVRFPLVQDLILIFYLEEMPVGSWDNAFPENRFALFEGVQLSCFVHGSFFLFFSPRVNGAVVPNGIDGFLDLFNDETEGFLFLTLY